LNSYWQPDPLKLRFIGNQKSIHMKLSLLITTTTLILSNFSFSQSYSEGVDLPGTGTGPAFTITGALITIQGRLTTPNDGQDRFQIIVPNGCTVLGATYQITDGQSLGLTGFAQFGSGNQMTTPPLSGSFTTGPTGPFPVGPGTYDCMMVANVASQDAWRIVFQANCVVTGVKEQFKWEEAQVYPNPTQGEYNLSFKATGNVVVRLVDIQGKLIFEDDKGIMTGPTIINYNMNDYESGIYFLELTNGSETNNIKVIKK